ncbi:cobalamin biosynthesis protein CbiX [Sulfuriferula sp. AH1]|uniref:sirohydrochlorin chelatase n=1 Tax=Sulfuriferula sp. AH1 TaxID=1985873 RepID=UPI000B3B9BD8|nr:CbiX/SirB N-terminal domain-containing protein [Sulfuriferula sp. AH1]ARU32468.1 cobalamin biosynthesis protein CbiX [Sulfuriferula sp. AH1]
MNAVILFAHGARDPRWAEPFQRLQQIVAAQQPQSRVMLAYLELMSPGLPDAVAALVAQGIADISIVPLFLGPGAHLREDFPILLDELRQRYPLVSLTVLPALGESDALLHAIAGWIKQVMPYTPD